MNEVTLQNWEGQPVHCPFCGQALPADESVSCKHLLYVISSGMFCHRSERFNAVLGLDEENYPDLTKDQHEKYGDVYQIAEKSRQTFHNHMEFIYDSNWNSIHIGFATYDDELSYWGHHPASTYE